MVYSSRLLDATIIQSESPASVIDNYNKTFKAQVEQPDAAPTNPISAAMGLFKGMMPLKKGEKGVQYQPILKDGDLCVASVPESES